MVLRVSVVPHAHPQTDNDAHEKPEINLRVCEPDQAALKIQYQCLQPISFSGRVVPQNEALRGSESESFGGNEVCSRLDGRV